MARLLLTPVFALVLIATPAEAQISLLGLRNSLVQFALRQISTPGGFEITAGRVTEPQDGLTELTDVRIADAAGVWFEADALGLSWSPTRILRGELQINRLTARGVRVLRRPGETGVELAEDAVPEPRAPFEWPRAPITTLIDSIEATDVLVAAGVLGPESVRFDATGAARDAGDEQAARLTLDRIDAVEGRIALDYLRDFGADALRLDLTAEEGPGGLVAALAGLPPETDVRLTVDAAGPLTDWALVFAAEARDALAAEGRATLALGRPFALDVDVSARPGPALPPAARAAFAPEARLVARAREDADGLVRIEAARLSAPALTLAADGTFDREASVADFTVAAEALPPLAALVEGVDFARVGFDGAVSGPLDALSAAGALTLADLRTAPVDVAEAAFEARATVAGAAVSLSAEGFADGLRLDRLAPETVGRATLALDAAFDGGVVTLTAFRLDSPLLSAEASGAADLAGDDAALTYAARVPALAPLAAAYDVDAAGAVGAEGRATGALSALALSGALTLEAFVFDGEPYGDATLTHAVTLGEAPAGRVDLAANGGRFGAATAGADFRFAQPTLALENLAVAALGAEAAGALTLDVETLLADGTLDLRLGDLGALGAEAGLTLTGSAAGRVALTSADGAQAATVDVSGEDVEGFDARLDRFALVADLRDVLRAPEGDASLTVDGLAAPGVSVAALALDGRARAADGVSAEATLSASAIEGFGATVARLSGAVSARDLTGAGAAEASLTAEDVAYPAAEARVARLTAEATARDLFAALAAEATVVAEQIAAAGATVARLDADGAATLGAAGPEGRVSARLATVAAGDARTESVTLDAALAQGAAGATATAALAAAPARLGAMRLGALDAAATVEDALGEDPALDLRASLGASDLGAATLSRLGATASGRRSALALALDADGAAGGEPLVAALRATANLADPAAVTADVARLEASLGAARAALRRPARIEAGDSIRVSRLDLEIPGGGLTGAAALHPNGMEADLVLDLPDAAALAAFADAPLDAGAIRVEAALDTRPGSARGRATLTGRDLRPSGVDLGRSSLRLDGEARWNGTRAAVDVSLAGPFDQPVRLEAALPLRPTGGPLPAVPARAEIDGRLRWAGRIGDIWSVVPAADHVLDGDATIDIALSGPLAAPSASGEIWLRNGQYQNLETGTILQNLTVESDIEADGALALMLSADDGAGAPVTGRVALADGAVSGRIQTRDAVLVRRDDATAALSLDIRAEGPLAGPAITGTVRVDRAEIRLVNATPPSLPDLGPVRIRGEEPQEPRPGPGAGVTLDVRVEGPGQIYARGRGLESEWRVDLAVRGTAADPQVTGVVERIRGQLLLVGFPFALERGLVSFTGDLDPSLDIALIRENEGVRGGVVVRGFASAPEVGFESEPPLPEDEVLPRVLFGASQQSLTQAQAIQIALGLAILLDGSGGPLDALRSTLGVDTVMFSDDDGELEVTVGRTVADGVFVGAKQPLDGGSARVVVEVQVFDDIVVDTEVGPDSGASVGVNWRRDY
ncbi:MAG: hypothetical protein EA355_04775 [Rhodobacteraceae bacterium]|nr:MAG: hypothetical protein EA355_04775 [Paracoccaceae bacterium]